MLSWMELRHSGIHLLVRHQERVLCSAVLKHLSQSWQKEDKGWKMKPCLTREKFHWRLLAPF